ncbi:MAG: putative Ig domain-containing protein [Planctomycetota bacterium]
MTITSAGRVQWTPTAGDVGRTGTYVVRVSDGRGGVDSEVFQYEVNLDAASQNQPPEFQSDPRRRALATRPYAYNANAIDPDNDRLTYSLSQGPVGMSIHPDTGLVRFTPSLGQLGEHTVSIVASDIAGASDTQTFTLRVVRGDAPPQIISSPSVHSREGDFYHYAVTATDDDGDQLVFSFDTGTAANLPLSIDPFTGVISGITPTQASYDIVVRATDPTGRFDTQSYTLNVTADGSNGANNRPPVIISEPKTTARSGTEYVFDFAAIDPDLDFGDFLTWTKSPESPSTTNSVTFDTTTQQLRWLPDASEIDSTIQFALKVEDSFGASSSISWLVWVREPNVAPQIADIDDQFVVAGATLAVDVDATDPNNDPLTYGMDPASLGRGITIDDLGRVRWETSATDLDSPTQTVTVTVSDGFADPVSTTFDVTLLPDNAPPEVYLDGSPGFLDAGDDVDLLVRAFDNVAVVDTTLTLVSVTDFDGQETILNWDVPLSDAGAARFLTDVSHLGSLRFVATASDAMGLTASDEFVLRVFDPSDTNRPQVTLISPQSGDAPLSPVDIVGTVSDDIAAGLFWTLTIQALDSSAAPRILTRGQGPVTAAPLELLDPTNLRDGAYTLTLSAIDAGGNTASDSETIDIKTDLKLGNFAVSFTDLEVPVAGLPITITRSYDTLDADVMGDFGYGWSLEFTMPKMYVVRSSLGVPSFERYGTFINGTRVNVVTPEGNTEGFTFFWRPGSEGINNIGVNGSTRYIPTFEGDSGNQYRLIPPASDGHFRRLTEEGPHQDDSGRLYSGLDPVFGGVFQLKQADSRGQQLDYDILVGPRGTVEMTAHRVRDKCGNALELQPDGIRSNRGRSVQFIRDGAGRITEIIDPRGNSMLYRYNSDGQLVEFYDRRATERLRDEVQNNEFAPTRFAYGPEFPDNAFSSVPGVENYLTEIIDPLGITAVQQTYDPVSGRLQSLQDADGNEQEMAYDIRIDEAGVQSQTSGLNPVESTFDQFNRLTSEKTASGQTTLYTYADDDIRYPYQIIQVIGDPDGADAWADRSGDDRVTTRQYQTEFAGQGAVSEEVDPDGQRTLTAYHFRGSERGYPKRVIHPDEKLTDYKWGTQGLEQKVELVAQVDQDGNSTEYGYDDYGNVNVLHQGNEITGTLSRTGFVYDTFGDLVAVEDADQNVRKITYNLNGDQTGTEFAHYPGDQRPPREFELRYLVDEYGETNNLDPADFPATRTLIRTVNDLDVEGDVLTSRTEVVQQTFDADTMEYIDDGPVEVRNDGASTAYDALGRAAESQSENGRRTLTVYDKRGLAVETYTEAPNENGAASWFVSRTVYDSQGRAVHSTGSFPLGTPVSEITGTHSIYDTDVAVDLDDDGIVDSDLSGAQTGRMLGSDQLVGTEITVTPIAGSPTIDIVHNDQVFSIATLATSSLTQAGTKISHSRSFYDDNDRVTSTENDKGLRTQTLYDDDGRVIESRSEMTPSNIGGTIQSYWSVSRTLYDEDGKVLASTDRFLVPIDTPLGQDPVDGQGGSAPVATQVTMTRYDDQDRTIATERYVGAIVSPITGEFGFEIASPGTLESVSETLYDAAGRVWRSVSGRIPYATASTTEQQQSDALSNYPIYGFDEDNQTIQDAYHGLGLTTGIITDTLFDDRGRQFATLGHPLLASELGLTSGDLPAAAPAPESTLVRHRSETIYNGYGQTQIQRSGLAQLQGLGAAHIDVIDIDSVDMVSHYDAFGNVDRMEYVTGGTLALDAVATLDRDAHVRSGGTVDSYTRTRFDDENRPLAEMQQTAGSVATMWNDEQQSFVVDTGIVGGGDLIPTKLYHYDEDDRLEAVTLATLESIDPNSLEIVQQRATYHYQYDDRGNQVGIIDPLGRHTRFQFDDRGRQVSRTLPLGLGPDGEFGTSDDPASFDPGQNGAFTEGFQYDQEGRQTIHISFEGEITQSIYDAYDRMWAMNYFASQADFDNNRVT